MATKRKLQRKRARVTAPKTPQARLLKAMNEVWLAGLGAAMKAQRGAPQLYEDLIAEGAKVHVATRAKAEKALRGILGEVQSSVNARIGEVSGKANEAFEGLEKIFQTRVHRALAQLGVPTAEDVETLSKKVEALTGSIEKLGRARAHPRAPARAVTPPPHVS
ncbi:MAG TPA: phasin family protein [Steroidobacteraceae bacterium]|nr:phasin family protein [Steroidobacteraceae bacterium]